MINLPTDTSQNILRESGNTLKVYIYLLRQSALMGIDRIQLSQQKIANDCSLSHVTVGNAINRLASLRLVTPKAQRKPNRPNVYLLSPFPDYHTQSSYQITSNHEQSFSTWLKQMRESDYKALKQIYGAPLSQANLKSYYELYVLKQESL